MPDFSELFLMNLNASVREDKKLLLIQRIYYIEKPEVNVTSGFSYIYIHPVHGSITTSILLPCPNSFLAKAWSLAGVMPFIVSSYAVSPLNPRK